MIDDSTKRRLLFRASHRGIREMDIVLGRYCKTHIDTMDNEKILLLSLLLHLDDQPLSQALSESDPDDAFHVLVSDIPSSAKEGMLLMLQDIHEWMRAHPYRGE